MAKIKKLCVISNYFPSETDPYFTFVGTLIDALADEGIECNVITPVSYMEKKHKGQTREHITQKGNKVKIYCPRYVVFPNRIIAGYRTFRLTVAAQRIAIYRTYKKYVKDCDAVYAHFLDSGINSQWLGKKIDKPSFVACGECSITYSRPAYETFGKDIHNGFNGVVYVSAALKQEVDGYDIISEKTPTTVLPNSIETDVFKPLDKLECRKALNICESDFVIVFVGGFIERKGFDKLQNIVMRHSDWKIIMIGAGEIPISVKKNQIVFQGRLPHNDIPAYSCAADVFVLPTLAEGCCNAIVEALGCGLPVISSDRSFNDDILDETCSIRVDPESEEDIEKAIMLLHTNDRLRNELAEGAASKGRQFSITSRAKRLLEFMERSYEK